MRLARFAGEADERVLLAAALAVRAPRLGHVYVDLATVRHTATVDVDVPVDLQTLPWPDPPAWVAALLGSPLVANGENGPDVRPLRLIGSWLYLDRYWREERQVAADLAVRAEHSFGRRRPGSAARRPGPAVPRRRTERRGRPDRQRLAAAVAVLRPLTVVAGGPGTGKTTTVARILALLDEQAQAAGAPPPLVALTAPTGKAAARLEEAVHQEAATLDVADELRSRLLGTKASTLHRLLGWQPGNRSRFRHHRGNRLPHDVVVVDETSMVSLSQMAKLVEAVRPDARLVLVGDPQQLASVEAGAVLGDIVGPAADRLLMRPAARAALAEATGEPIDDAAEPIPFRRPVRSAGPMLLRRRSATESCRRSAVSMRDRRRHRGSPAGPSLRWRNRVPCRCGSPRGRRCHHRCALGRQGRRVVDRGRSRRAHRRDPRSGAGRGGRGRRRHC